MVHFCKLPIFQTVQHIGLYLDFKIYPAWIFLILNPYQIKTEAAYHYEVPNK